MIKLFIEKESQVRKLNSLLQSTANKMKQVEQNRIKREKD